MCKELVNYELSIFKNNESLKLVFKFLYSIYCFGAKMLLANKSTFEGSTKSNPQMNVYGACYQIIKKIDPCVKSTSFNTPSQVFIPVRSILNAKN